MLEKNQMVEDGTGNKKETQLELVKTKELDPGTAGIEFCQTHRIDKIELTYKRTPMKEIQGMVMRRKMITLKNQNYTPPPNPKQLPLIVSSALNNKISW